MTDHTTPKAKPNPAFLVTQIRGSHDLHNTNQHLQPSDVPTNQPAQPRHPRHPNDPTTSFPLTNRSARCRGSTPSFTKTIKGPAILADASTQCQRVDDQPSAPIALLLADSVSKPNPEPPVELNRFHSDSRSDHAAPMQHQPMQCQPMLLQPMQRQPMQRQPMQCDPMDRSKQQPRMSTCRHLRRKHAWKRMVPAPQFLSSGPIAQPIPMRSTHAATGPKPVEDRFLNALGILALGLIVATAAGFGLLVVTQSHIEALAPFLSQPDAASPTTLTP